MLNVNVPAVSGNTSYTARLQNGTTYSGTLPATGSSNIFSMQSSDLILLTSTSPVLVSQFSKVKCSFCWLRSSQCNVGFKKYSFFQSACLSVQLVVCFTFV